MMSLRKIIREWYVLFKYQFENIRYARYGYSQFKVTVNNLDHSEFPYIEQFSIANSVYSAILSDHPPTCSSVSLYGFYYPTEKWELLHYKPTL